MWFSYAHWIILCAGGSKPLGRSQTIAEIQSDIVTVQRKIEDKKVEINTLEKIRTKKGKALRTKLKDLKTERNTMERNLSDLKSELIDALLAYDKEKILLNEEKILLIRQERLRTGG